MRAGRTGTRMNISRPQVRWADGVEIARVASQSRSVAERGNNARTISTIISEALQQARNFAQHYQESIT